MKTISDTIFELLKEKKMSQKEFSKQTGIAESTISDWKKKRTNPVSDKILPICNVLEITPGELLSGAEVNRYHREQSDYLVIDKASSLGTLVETYQSLDANQRRQLQGYLDALRTMNQTQE